MGGLLRVIAQLILFVVLVYGAGAVLKAVLSAAFPGFMKGRAAKGGRPGALRSPAPRAVVRSAGRGVLGLAAEAGITNWIEQRRHERQNGNGGGTATAAPPKRGIRQRLRLAPLPPAAPNGNGQANGGSRSAPQAPPPSVTGGTVPSSGQPSYKGGGFGKYVGSASSSGGTVAAGTSTASAEKLIEGINEIHAHAQAGGIHAKQEAVKAAHEASVRFAAMVQMLARQMSEPGQNYGREITEPLAQAGNHHQASAMSLSESDAAISTLINMTVGDLARSARQAPHHAELSENGSR